MGTLARRPLPLRPLLAAYVSGGLRDPAELGLRCRAVLSARAGFLNESFLDQASEDEFRAVLTRFYEACLPYALHLDALQRRAGILRHALSHLLRGTDALPARLARCLETQGPYRVAGLGPMFWSAIVQGLDPVRHPAWTPAIVTGLRRLGLVRGLWAEDPAYAYGILLDAYDYLRTSHAELPALHVDHFLTLVARMRGRELFTELESAGIREVGTPAPPAARSEVEAGLARGEAERVLAALRLAAPPGLAADQVLIWTGRLWEADVPYAMLDAFWRADPLPAIDGSFPIAVLQARDPQRFFAWEDRVRRGLASLEDDADQGETPAERYRLFNEAIGRFCAGQQLDAREAPALLANLGANQEEIVPAHFGGFCTDTFRFLAELGNNNSRAWMDTQRERYHFAVRDPLIELCQALAERYVEPVLGRQRGWDLETAARGGRALTSIVKNDYGRSVPYQTELWITFYPRRPRESSSRGRGAEAQLFVRVDAAGLSYGVCLGRQARETAQRFRQNVEEHADRLFRTLADNGALADCRFGRAADLGTAAFGAQPAGPDDLRTWAARAGAQPAVARCVPADSPLLRAEDLVGDILLTFDRLLPLFACAVETDPRPWLAEPVSVGAYDEGDFQRDTYLDTGWLGRARALLELKRQLILQGVPGTGKTHVARCLAALLAGGRDEAVRLVQFHPAYSYEEFVEGIKVRSVEVEGRHDVTYPVEDGLLCTFAAEAERRPDQPHVLIVDEINRGNLPRVFGELLYLLEYRGQTIRLPYSRRSFGLPENLYLLGTMNAADRSVTLVDQALRRRFSFLEMPPDAAVLAAWLRTHPPAAGPAFADAVVSLFERLNARLRADLGPAAQVGHSYFMVPHLDEPSLGVIWEHHLTPLLDEYFAGQPGRAAGYTLESFLTPAERRSSRSERRKRREAGARIVVNPP